MSVFSALENFFSAYFHQDWTVEHDTPEAVVDYYLDSEPVGEVARVREDLDRLLAQDLEEDELAQKVQDFGSYYDPSADGASYRDWLSGLSERLAR